MILLLVRVRRWRLVVGLTYLVLGHVDGRRVALSIRRGVEVRGRRRIAPPSRPRLRTWFGADPDGPDHRCEPHYHDDSCRICGEVA